MAALRREGLARPELRSLALAPRKAAPGFARQAPPLARAPNSAGRRTGEAVIDYMAGAKRVKGNCGISQTALVG